MIYELQLSLGSIEKVREKWHGEWETAAGHTDFLNLRLIQCPISPRRHVIPSLLPLYSCERECECRLRFIWRLSLIPVSISTSEWVSKTQKKALVNKEILTEMTRRERLWMRREKLNLTSRKSRKASWHFLEWMSRTTWMSSSTPKAFHNSRRIPRFPRTFSSLGLNKLY